jgi:hypothetical protein
MRQKQQNRTNSCGANEIRYIDAACPNAGETCDATAPNYCKAPTCNGSIGAGCNASSPPAYGYCGGAPTCAYQCDAGYGWDGTACVTTSNTLWSCKSNNYREAVGSCNGSPAYAGSTTYGLNQVACQPNNNPNPNPANCVVCSASQGNACNSNINNCNESYAGTIQCDGSCSVGSTPPANRTPCNCVTSPVVGSSCTSAPNNCADTNVGTYQCNGSCSAIAPPDTTCNQPIDGVCGSALNACNTSPGQSASNIASNSTADTWDCNGWYGGNVAHCSKPK